VVKAWPSASLLTSVYIARFTDLFVIDHQFFGHDLIEDYYLDVIALFQFLFTTLISGDRYLSIRC